MTAPGDLYRCRSCGLVAMEPMPTREELPALYPAEYENFSGTPQPGRAVLLRRYQRRQADICRRHLPPDGRILEIGCATGDVLAELADEYPVVQGIELSEEACDGGARSWPRRVLRHARGVRDRPAVRRGVHEPRDRARPRPRRHRRRDRPAARARRRPVPRDPERRVARRPRVEAALGPDPLPASPLPVRPRHGHPPPRLRRPHPGGGALGAQQLRLGALGAVRAPPARDRPFEGAAIAVLPGPADAVPPAQPPRRRLRRHRLHVGDRPQGARPRYRHERHRRHRTGRARPARRAAPGASAPRAQRAERGAARAGRRVADRLVLARLERTCRSGPTCRSRWSRA